jgi:serine/threonine protein kinase
MTFGPDVAKILMLLDKLPTGDENELTFEKMENIYTYDAYIAPEIIKKINLEKPSNKVDSWLFGVLLFNVIFGVTPESFYSQLKKYCENYLENCNMEQVLIDDEFDVLKTNFFYNPFTNIKIIMEDKFYFTKILRANSFSAIIKSKYIKSNDNHSYDMSEFIDLINACLNIDPEKRPSIVDLINFNLFEVPLDLQERYSKTLSNVMDYYSPDSVIK